MDIDTIGLLAQAAKAEATKALWANQFAHFARAQALGDELEHMAEHEVCSLRRLQEIADKAEAAQLQMAQQVQEEIAWALIGE